MTAMQQIEKLCIEARAHGMTYGEYIDKYKPNMPKPRPTNKREIKYYHGIGHEKYRERKTTELTCVICGGKFLAKIKTAKYCEECRKELQRERNRECKRKQKKEKESKV